VRVLHHIPHFWPNFGGVEALGSRLRRALSAGPAATAARGDGT
jgi:hypothetical protein